MKRLSFGGIVGTLFLGSGFSVEHLSSKMCILPSATGSEDDLEEVTSSAQMFHHLLNLDKSTCLG